MDKTAVYLQPREKLQQKGAAGLSHSELLQVLIGSGNAQSSVVRIAKRTLRALSRHGPEVTFNELVSIAGLGPARACQILAMFELASRYPLGPRQLTINSADKIVASLAELRQARHDSLVFIALDGAYRQINKRIINLNKRHPSDVLREIFSGLLQDGATRVIIGIGSIDKSLEPSMFELSLARDLRAMAQLFHVTIRTVMLVNKLSERPIKVDI